MLWQQGDVLMEPVSRIKGERLAHKRLAEGEATGHAHVAVADDVVIYEEGETIYLDAPTGTEIAHEEHATVTLPPGTYRVRKVREFDHFAEEARNVQD